MPDLYVSYNVFVSGPRDVKKERQITEDIISNINKTCKDILKSSLEVKKWEDLPPETPKLPEQKIQDIINKEVAKSHFFILILYKRYGSIEPGHSISNTERELNTILERFKSHPELKILAYFREIPDNSDPGEQEQKVLDFRRRLEQLGVFYKDYKEPNEFKDMLTHDLYNVMLRMRFFTYKVQALNNFWQFGESDRPTDHHLAIMYPMVDRYYMDQSKDADFWFKRLIPTLYFEDYKALHKIVKTLTKIGFPQYKIYSHSNTPADLQFMNRVWICMPRYKRANIQLEKYSNETRFKFTRRTPNTSAIIEWKLKSGEIIEIKSPLKHYLKEQRQKMDLTADWNPQLERIIGKDYAILARFNDTESSAFSNGSFLRDYFIAGIRGLGTWGVGWFIDRKCKQLLEYKESDNIQILLETIYRNGRIFDVRNVSNEPAEYFVKQNSLRTIRQTIKEYLES